MGSDSDPHEQPMVQRRTRLAVSSIFSTMPFDVTVPAPVNG